jgi:hypothetical protein
MKSNITNKVNIIIQYFDFVNWHWKKGGKEKELETWKTKTKQKTWRESEKTINHQIVLVISSSSSFFLLLVHDFNMEFVLVTLARELKRITNEINQNKDHGDWDAGRNY